MTDGSAELQRRIADMDARLRDFEERLQRLEGSGVSVSPLPRVARPAAMAMPVVVPEPDRRSDIALAGRSLIAIGGAYLLRALTETSTVPRVVGLTLGLVYAFVWIYVANRHASRHDAHAAGFSSIVAAIIAYPLLWEATAHFQSFSVGIASLLMLVVSSALIAIAWRHAIPIVAWLATLGTFGCAVALIASTEQPSLPFLALSVAGAMTWHVASKHKWPVVRWPAVAFAWLIAVPMEIVVAAKRAAEPAELVVIALLIGGFAYLGAIAAKNLLTRVDIDLPDIIQAVGTILAILAGTAWIASGLPGLSPGFAVAIAGVAIGTYVTAVRQPPEDARAAWYFAGVALAFTLIATSISFTPPVAGLIWIVLAIAAAIAAPRLDEPQFTLHAVAYTIAGAIATGLLGNTLSAITGIGKARPAGFAMIAASSGIAIATTLLLLLRESPVTLLGRAARLTLLSLSTLIVIAAASSTSVGLIGGDGATSAAVRSVTIAVGAVLIAQLARVRLLSGLSSLVYPLLGLGAAKFIADDAMSGRALTLFVALSVYGAALVILARTRRAPAAVIDHSLAGREKHA